MADASLGPSSFLTQADALLRKNLTFQKRNCGSNCRLVLFPLLLCLLLFLTQTAIDYVMDKPEMKCGCNCLEKTGNGRCVKKVCGIEYSDASQAKYCANPSPPKWAPLVQIPTPENRAVKSNFIPFTDLPDESCRRIESCPATVLVTGNNHSLGDRLSTNMFTSSVTLNISDMDGLANIVLGSDTLPDQTTFYEPAFVSERPLYHLQSQCKPNSKFSFPVQLGNVTVRKEVTCVQALYLWRNSSSEVNDELYKGYEKGNSDLKTNEIAAAYDFLNSDFKIFNVNIWYNATYKKDTGTEPMALVRVPRMVNLVSNAYLQLLRGSGTKMLFEFVKEMPKPENQSKMDIASLVGVLFFTWVVLQLFPVVLTALVYEKQQNLRIMMKMHGLGDGPYWTISYAYFLLISSIYMLCFVLFGSCLGFKFFTYNAYSIQFAFYFIYINLQISLAFLVAVIFSDVKTATVIAYICVFGTGLLGSYLFQAFLHDTSLPRGWITFMELYPGFSLYRGLYEFADYANTGVNMGTQGMQWGNLNDSANGMKEVLIIMFVEWLVVLFVAKYIDKAISSGSPLFFLQKSYKKPSQSFQTPSMRRHGSKVFVQMEKSGVAPVFDTEDGCSTTSDSGLLDVTQEKEKVKQLLLQPTVTHAIVSDNLKKVYPGKDGNPDKFAVRGLHLAIPRGECFGMLGPNGAGKTSLIKMLIGLTKPSYGTALIEGLDIQTQMDEIYTGMGVCPQYDLLWETLTGREHLLFYGRLKNLKGAALTQAVDDSLTGLNLGAVGNKQAGAYSGGMKRRLSVAISLIGDPKVVYMDEPSTGLDPASRNSLWNVVKRAKQGRAIFLTTHSMEEAEALCDRLGIFVDGGLQCVGNSKELKARYGGAYVFTMTTSANYEYEVENLVRRLSANGKKIYQISGTLKFELPKHEVRIADVFQAVEHAKSRFTVHAWGLADTTLEDVFIKVARGAQAFQPVA